MKKIVKRFAALVTAAATLCSITACEDLLGSTIQSDSTSASTASSEKACNHNLKLVNVILAPTKDENGVGEYVCNICFETLRLAIPKLSDDSGNSESVSGETENGGNESADGGTSEDVEKPQPSQGPIVYDGGAVTVTFYHTLDSLQRDILDDCLEEFNKLYPNITVYHENKGSTAMLREEISLGLMANLAPSIAFCTPEDSIFYQNKQAIINLDEELFDSKEQVLTANGKTEMMGFTQAQASDLNAAFLNEDRYFGGGDLYSLPLSGTTNVMYYNKTYFETNNLSVPTTWEEVEEVCALIKAQNSNSCPLVVDGDADLFITRAEQLGEPYVSATGEKLFNTVKNRAMVEELREWYEKGYIITDGVLENYTSGLFQSEGAYMAIGSSLSSSWYVPNGNRFEVGVAMIPQEDVNNARVPFSGTSVCLFKQDNTQEMAAAWLLMKYLTTSTEYQVNVSIETGKIPVVHSVFNDAAYQEFLQKADGGEFLKATVVTQSFAQMHAYFITPMFEGAGSVKESLRALMIDCISGRLPSGKTAASFIKENFDNAVQ